MARNIGGELNLAVWRSITLKSAKISYSHTLYIHAAIPYRTVKIVILGSTDNFNSHQYFWIYGMFTVQSVCTWVHV